MISEKVLEEIRENYDFSGLLKKSQRGNYICPFCGSGTGPDKSGALSIDRRTNRWKCFKCEASGDAIDIIQEIERLSFADAARLAAQRMGLEAESPLMDKDIKGHEKNAKNGRESLKAGNAAADYTEYYKRCAEQLPGSPGASYLKGRGISLKTAQAFGLGYDPKADPAQSGYKSPRVIIPVSKSYFTGRAIDPAAKYKYQNVKGEKTTLFNARALNTGGAVFVYEGAIDAMSAAELGYNAIALNSAGNREHLISALEIIQERPRFIICFDADAKEDTAATIKKHAADLCDQLQARGYKAIVFDIRAYLENGEKDFNDILRRNRESAKSMLEAAQGQLASAPDPTPCADLDNFLQSVKSEKFKPLLTGTDFFDDLTGGVIRQTLLLLMAAPGVGKTTLCQAIAEGMAEQQRASVIYLNFEMSREQMLAKAISARLSRKGRQISALEVMRGYSWTLERQADITAEIEEYGQKVYSNIKYNPAEVRADLKSLSEYLNKIGQAAEAAGQPAPVLVVDYLHLITSPGMEAGETVKAAVEKLKEYAIRYNTFVIGIAAINRAGIENGANMSSGRDSSALEYTADYIITLEYYDIDSGKINPSKQKSSFAALQKERWRRLILRLSKSRYTSAGKTKKVYFSPHDNVFKAWISDYDRPEGAEPFDTPQPIGRRI